MPPLGRSQIWALPLWYWYLVLPSTVKCLWVLKCVSFVTVHLPTSIPKLKSWSWSRPSYMPQHGAEGLLHKGCSRRQPFIKRSYQTPKHDGCHSYLHFQWLNVIQVNMCISQSMYEVTWLHPKCKQNGKCFSFNSFKTHHLKAHYVHCADIPRLFRK